MNSLRLILSHKRYFAPAYAFLCLNFIYGTWAIYIPQIKENLGIDKAELGLAIFAMALGSFVSLILAPSINERIGCGKATAYGITALCIFGAGPFLATNFASLTTTLFFLGMAQGFLDVSMNATVAQMEKDDEVTLMAAMHGFFSLGGVIAGLGTFLITFFDSALLHISLMIGLIIVFNLSLTRQYRNIAAPKTQKTGGSFSRLWGLLLLGMICFVVMGSEGAIVDWSGLYLKEIAGAPEHLLGAGFLGFSVAMTLGRFFGDFLSDELGSEGVIGLGTLVAFLGYLGVLQHNLNMSIAGFTAIGAGLSVMVPELFRMAGRTKQMAPSRAIAFVAGLGYIGFLTGPVILGFTADYYGLRTSYYGLTASIALIGLIALALYFQSVKNKREAA